jgi:magnesium transporter
VPSHLIDQSGATDVGLDRATIERLRGQDRFWWLDLHQPTDEELGLVGEVLGFHILAIEDAMHFGQRPKLDEYDDFALLVVYGAAHDDDDVVEVHCFYSARFLVTVRRDHCLAFAEARERHAVRPERLDEPALVLYRVLDGLVDSFFPLLTTVDEFIDAIEEGIFAGPNQEHLRRVFLMKRRLAALRRVIAPQRDLVATIASGVAELPAMTPEAERGFRDVYDHLIRLTDTIDGYRDLLSGATDAYLSTVSNRLNDVTKQLAVIATIFLPLTFITGFFGQNFAWLVEAVGGELQFWVLGVGLQVVAVIALLALFRHRRWF